MGDLHVDTPNAPPVVSPEEMAGRFHAELIGAMGELPAGKEFKGKHISVQIDGGRTKIRGDLRPATVQAEKMNEEGRVVENAPGRSKKRPRQTFDAEWREPIGIQQSNATVG